MKNVRFLVALLFAAGVTFALFRLMSLLIGVEGKLEKASRTTAIEFVRLKHETETEVKKREIPDRKAPEKEPPPPEVDLSRDFRPDTGDAIFAEPFDGQAELSNDGLAGLAAADSDVVPLVRIDPEYPMRAISRRIEGWVEVEFTISKAGTVKDPRVVAYDPSPIFNKSVLRAIRRWKYNPRMMDGSPVERPGVIVRLDFELEK